MTSIEWLEDNIHNDFTYNQIMDLLEQAKEMHKVETERMYSEKEVIKFLDKREDYVNETSSIIDYQTAKEWFEQFKKDNL